MLHARLTCGGRLRIFLAGTISVGSKRCAHRQRPWEKLPQSGQQGIPIYHPWHCNQKTLTLIPKLFRTNRTRFTIYIGGAPFRESIHESVRTLTLLPGALHAEIAELRGHLAEAALQAASTDMEERAWKLFSFSGRLLFNSTCRRRGGSTRSAW